MQTAIASPSDAEPMEVFEPNRSSTALDQWSEHDSQGSMPNHHGQHGGRCNNADEAPEYDTEVTTPPNELDAMDVDDDGSSSLQSLKPFCLLPQLVPRESIGNYMMQRSKITRSKLVIFEDEDFFNDGERLRRPEYQEMVLHPSPRCRPRSLLYYCCQCSMGPQVWQMNPCCSYCYAPACSGCKGWATD